MRLFVHNFLQCHARGCEGNNYPLPIAPASGTDSVEVEELDAEFNADFLRAYLPRLEWRVLRETACGLGLKEAELLPEEAPEEPEEDVLRALHVVLMCMDVKSAQMVCPSCSHVYLIRDSIPNMLLNEDEV